MATTKSEGVSAASDEQEAAGVDAVAAANAAAAAADAATGAAETADEAADEDAKAAPEEDAADAAEDDRAPAGGAADNAADEDEDDEERDPTRPYFARTPAGQTLVEAIPTPATRGMFSAAVAVTGAALGLASITGTWLSGLISDREQLIGQIHSSGKSTAEVISASYGKPWHATALLNGSFAVLALLVVGGVLLVSALRGGSYRAAPWVRAVAWAGLMLAVLGLAISAFMYFDVFTHLPKAPATSTSSGGTG